VFDELRPTPPEFQLAGDAGAGGDYLRGVGVDARELDLPCRSTGRRTATPSSCSPSAA